MIFLLESFLSILKPRHYPFKLHKEIQEKGRYSNNYDYFITNINKLGFLKF